MCNRVQLEDNQSKFVRRRRQKSTEKIYRDTIEMKCTKERHQKTGRKENVQDDAKRYSGKKLYEDRLERNYTKIGEKKLYKDRVKRNYTNMSGKILYKDGVERNY